MAQHAPCCFPGFGATIDGPKRPISLRMRVSPSQNTKLLLAYEQGRLTPLLKTAWGLLLYRYTGLEEICFGYQYIGICAKPGSSRRPNLSICNLMIDENDTIQTILKKVETGKSRENDLVDGTDAYRNCYGLFNTVLMVRACRDAVKGTGETPIRPALPVALPEECRVRLDAKVLQEEICFFLEWWNNDISSTHMGSIIRYLDHILAETLLEEDTIVHNLNFFTENDWSRVWKFNSVLPETCDSCIHHIIQKQARLYPQREAVCAWDGSLSYGELDHLSSKLAYRLQNQGVGPESRVALCFDKSKWNCVAMLGVLKAGGAFVPLDPSHPSSRLGSLVQSVGVGILLCSRNRSEILGNVAEILIPVDDSTLDEISLQPGEDIRDSGVKSHNAAYIIFTSGSTGKPKGTLLEHRAFLSNAIAHAAPMNIDRDCRMLQFAAHTFDASLIETLTPLFHGGCVCVPSEEERLNNIVKAINNMRVNVASLTPSFVKFIEPSKVMGLKTLILAGEAMSKTDLETWSRIQLVNAYGPTESAVAAVVNPNAHLSSDCRDIGFPVGTRCWVVNPKNHDELVPVGSPGELLLEGPTLARCYVNDQTKTDASFINNPIWSRTGTDSVDRRFYKTGDLVRYNSDAGSLTFIGRKDTQIKFHGQRIELGEIENSLNALQEIEHCLVFLSHAGFSQNRLVATVTLKERRRSNKTPFKPLQPSKKSLFVTDIREKLAARLPAYMIPAVWLCMEALPILPSGKLDRKAALNWVESMEYDPDKQIALGNSITSVTTSLGQSNTEDRLASIWSRVLNIPASQISLDEGFLSLGGDSIAAITCMGYCKKQGLGVTVQELLQSKSIRDLATRVKEIDQTVSYHETAEESFGLSPIQRLHFMARKEGQGYFNQSLRSRLSKRVEESDLRWAIETIVGSHSMLRSRLVDCGPPYALQQRITRDVDGSYHLRAHNIKSLDEIERAVSESQSSIDAFVGPMLAVDLFQTDDGRCFLSMVAHHLVVDIVSWRIILEDLEDLILNPEKTANLTESLPFQTWCRLQDEQCQSLISQNKGYLHDDMPAPDFAYWGMENCSITYGDVICETFEINHEESECILTKCHQSLQTEPIDILLASVLHAFGKVFRDRHLPVIYNEGHGREVWDSAIDISRTVGWFTTLYPILIPEGAADDLVETVIRVKDLRRRVSDNGRQEFTCRMFMAREDGQPRHHCPMEMSFNYVGQHRDLQRQDALFQLMDQMAGETGKGGGAADFGEKAPRFALFEISTLAVQGQLRFTFSFNKYIKHQGAIREWINCCRDTLQSLGRKLRTISPKPTLSSFPMLSLTYGELEKMLLNKLPSIKVTSPQMIEDIYPCTRMQQGILLARSRDPSFYAVHGTYEVKSNTGKPDIPRLTAAWREVVAHHTMLRTLFVHNLTDRELFGQVVLKSFDSYPVHLRCSEGRDALTTLKHRQPTVYDENEPHHRFTICEAKTGKLFCRLELSHAAMDGVSVSIILRDLQLAYDGKLGGPRVSFKDYIGYLNNIPQAVGLEYWCTYLARIEPCLFPELNDGNPIATKRLRTVRITFDAYRELQTVCEKHRLTLSTAFNTAWGLTLRLFCGSNDVCFCYMTSLRNAAVDGIESVVGPVINLLACRISISETNSVQDVLQKVQDDYMGCLPHSNVSLIDIQRELNLADTELFNTGISFRKIPNSTLLSNEEICFSPAGPIYDPAEFPLFVNIEASDSDANIELNYWTNHLSDQQASNVASVFLECLQNIIHNQAQSISQIENLSDLNKRQLRRWNTKPLEGICKCVPEVILERAQTMPDEPAIEAWDKSLTYFELDDLSSRFANYLIRLGLRTGGPVPICIDKSAWQIVAILGVLKAGGVCVPVGEPFLERNMDQWLPDQGALVALASPLRAHLLEEKVPDVIQVDGFLLEYLTDADVVHSTNIDPSDSAYVVFSEGGFSDPKLLILDHCSILTRASAFTSALGMGPNTKTFQLSPYTSDIFLQELFGTLMSGGCVCIPPDDKLTQLSTSINTLNANLLNLTPTMASGLHPSEVPGVQVLSLFGELVTKDIKEKWSQKVQLHSFYGTTECSSTCIYNLEPDILGGSRNIGSGNGCSTWLVDPSNDSRLVPVGCVGELVIQGPGVCPRGFHDREPTKERVIGTLETTRAVIIGPSLRQVKTGDLARYNSDGTLVFLGKKIERSAQQVHFTAQRIEEYLTDIMPPEYRCLVEAIDPDDNSSTSPFAVFLLPTTAKSMVTDGGFDVIGKRTNRFCDIVTKFNSHLSSIMPANRLPTLYFPVQRLLLTPLGKTNRHLLRDTCHALSEEVWNEFTTENLMMRARTQAEEPSSFNFLNGNLAYWRDYLTAAESCLFPALSQNKSPGGFSTKNLILSNVPRMRDQCEAAGIDMNVLLQVAWGLVLRCYTGMEDVFFGYRLPESILPIKLGLSNHLRLQDVLQKRKEEVAHMLDYAVPFEEIQRVMGFDQPAFFNTVYEYNENGDSANKTHTSSFRNNENLAQYRIIVNVNASRLSGVVNFGYESTCLTLDDIANITDCLEHTLDSLLNQLQPRTVLSDIEFFGNLSCQRVRQWNASLPDAPQKCAHEIIQEQVLSKPSSTLAICSWDGSFTYAELELLSNRLAKNLSNRGVGPEIFVALCFEKSAWAVVSQVAVLKAGGAFASLDPTHPENRLKALVDELGAYIVLCSTKHLEKVSRICNDAVVVSETTIKAMPDIALTNLDSTTSTSNAAYAIFTSGTTGKPKVTVLEHAALGIASRSFAAILGMNSSTRALQFSNYTFDVSVLETIIVLMTGGCICVPSDDERLNNLAGAIQRMSANFISCPPSVTNTLDPSSVPTLTTIINGGEKMTEAHIDRWSDRCVINAYGPSEATIIATASLKIDRNGVRANEETSSVGTALCGRAWIVDPHNHNRLLPVGAIGELLLEGCNVARGYLNNEKKTKEAFVSEPRWCKNPGLQDVLKHRERMYRTGDLVRYRFDGGICFITRNDTQIKLNGQRIELEEIEQQCIQFLPTGTQVAVEVVAPETKTIAKSLVGFFTTIDPKVDHNPPEDGVDNGAPIGISENLKRDITALSDYLSNVLPQFMVPKFFFPIRCLPLTSTGKLDRRRLRKLVESLSKEQFRQYNRSISGSRQVVGCGMESALRSLWSKALDLDQESISPYDSFFGLGGDSFSAMKLVGIASSQGILLSVPDIYGHPVLTDMAKRCEAMKSSLKRSNLEKFSLLPSSISSKDLLEEVSALCGCPVESISDIYPCSAMQEGLLTLSIKHQGAYIARPIFKISEDVDIEVFKASWQQAVDEFDILRTRIVHTETAGFAQVVINKEVISWDFEEDFNSLMASTFETNGGLLTKYAIVHSPSSSARYFVWIIHHALYDGWSIPQFLRRVEEIHLALPDKSKAVPYKIFIDYLLKRDVTQSDEFWKSQLSGLSCPAFPPNTTSESDSIRVGKRQTCSLSIKRISGGPEITVPELIRAAWAITVSAHTGSGDVCFGETLMGRNIGMEDITNVTGPVLTTVPMRIQVDNGLEINKYLHNVRKLTTSLIPHQHSGLHRIRKINSDTSLACKFRNLLVIQSDNGQLENSIMQPENNSTGGEFFTQPLVIECMIRESTLEVQAHHDELVINSRQTEKLISQLAFILEQLLKVTKGSQAKIGDLDIASPLDKLEIASWNQQPPTCVDRCVHDIIREIVLGQPQAPAICAWDGELSYQEMYEIALSFATYLTSCGICPETFVPICLDKSLWVVVAILGILIAGGGFVPLDPSHPTSRHKEILEEINATIILCSPQYHSRYRDFMKRVIPVSRETIRAYSSIQSGIKSPTYATPSNMAYAIFTSGSTGRAKGIIIDHRALSSSAVAFGPIVNLDKDSRTFQFASLTFDAAVLELLATLMHGGCVCIPNEEERLNDVAGAMKRMGVSWALLTPSIACILEPSMVPSLKVLVCGGEKLSREVVTKWSHRVKLLNAYGPAEAAIIAAVNTDFINHDFSCIGYGTPSTLTWVVDPENHDRLSPLGAVGELALEGPALAREYLKNPKKTAESFVYDPVWAKSFTHAFHSTRKIYKTGDLVKYNSDGSIEYIGRKDHQVKLHGQRMELGEIEHRLSEDSCVRHAVVILPQTGVLQQKLVAILSLNLLMVGPSILSDNTCELVNESDMIQCGHQDVKAIQKKLENQLPAYMVPQAWAVIKKVPMLVSGKLDRKKITHWVENIQQSTYNQIMNNCANLVSDRMGTKQEDEEPNISIPEILRDVFSQVLNIPRHNVDLSRTFISLGGDSITGMAVVSKARKYGLSLTLPRILQSQSLDDLALNSSINPPVRRQEEVESTEPFSVSPIQDMFFGLVNAKPQASSRFNQSITVQLTKRTSLSVIENAIRALVSKHSMFRARFSKTQNGTWQQRVTDNIDLSYEFRTSSAHNSQEMLSEIADSQYRVDIQNGPILVGTIFQLPDKPQVLFLVASHLCVDMVSWRVALQDIEENISNGSPMVEIPLSFQTWCNSLNEASREQDVGGFFKPSDLEYWGMKGLPNLYGQVKLQTFTMDEHMTALIFQRCHEVFRTETIEVLLSAAIHSFSRVFTNRETPIIYNESHGRDSHHPLADPSRTVGWFTTFSPVKVPRKLAFFETLRSVKDEKRMVTRYNSSEFARAVRHSSKKESPLPLEILFNYLGQLQQLENEENLFKHYGDIFNNETFKLAGDMGPETPRFALFEISAMIVQGKLHMSFTYNRQMLHEDQILRWVSECKRTLEDIIPDLKHAGPRPTLSDYPLLPITYDEFDILIHKTLPLAGIQRLDQVEDIYPCSPVQEGILLSQLRDSDQYLFNAIFELHHPQKGSVVDIAILKRAWSMVVARHSTLRSFFVESCCKGGSFDQVVLKTCNNHAIEIECENSNALDKLAAITLTERNKNCPLKLAHQLVICRTVSGRIFMKIEMNHTIIDGGSVDILLRDLRLAYNGQLPRGPGPLFSHYIKYIREQPQGDSLTYWGQHLSGLRPCYLPVSTEKSTNHQLDSMMVEFDRYPELQLLCENQSVTLANIALAAWAIVLRTYTSSDDVCFGYPSTGRDLPIPGIQNAAGIFINMLCCRVNLRNEQTLLDVSEMMQDNYIRCLPHQNCSLAQIQHMLGNQGNPLFNTTISIQNHSSLNDEDTDIRFELQTAHDPTEYPITVNVETGRGREGILLRYWTDAISKDEATNLVDALARALAWFVEEPLKPISELNLCSHLPRNKNEISQFPVRSTEKLKISERAICSNTLQRMIDSRIREVIGQMIKEGTLSIPRTTQHETNTPNGLFGFEEDSQDSIPEIVSSRGSTPSDSTQTLTSDYRDPSEEEKHLWKYWSTTLGLPLHPIRYHESFFKLGGDSVTAMKMVGVAREEGLMLTVADVFKNPVFEDMLAAVNSRNNIASPNVKTSSEEDIKKLYEEQAAIPKAAYNPEIAMLRPIQLDDILLREEILSKIDVFQGGIVDALPVTDFQSLSITAHSFKSRWMLNYFYLDGEGVLDIKRLRESFLHVVDAFDILRTVFVYLHGQFVQVVLRKVRPNIFVQETDKSLDEYIKSLQLRDREQATLQGEQLVQFHIVKRINTNQHRIIIRISHTQFDGVCLPRIMMAIKTGYEGSPTPPVSFLNYMRLLPGTITPQHYIHWTSLLKGSKMTEIVKRYVPNTFHHIGSFAEQKKTLDIPLATSGNVTIATIIQSAWAITLAKLSAQTDVVFGLTVSGRNATIPGIESTVGPCLNIIPVRVKFEERWTALDLFRYLQDQQVANMPYESIGFREIIRSCTDWPDSTYFTTSVFHQTLEYEGQMKLDHNTYRMGGVGVIDNFTDLTLVSKPVAGVPHKISVSLGYSLKGPIHPTFVAKILNMVCDVAQSLVVNPNVALPSPSTLRSLPSHHIDETNTPSNEALFVSSGLNNRNLSEIFIHSKLLTQIWQEVLPPRSNGKPHNSFQLDSSFFGLGGDLVNMAQIVWRLEQQGLHVCIEDLLEHHTFFGQMAVLALQKAKRDIPADHTEIETPPLPARYNTWGAMEKARTLAKKITRLGGLSTRI